MSKLERIFLSMWIDEIRNEMGPGEYNAASATLSKITLLKAELESLNEEIAATWDADRALAKRLALKRAGINSRLETLRSTLGRMQARLTVLGSAVRLSRDLYEEGEHKHALDVLTQAVRDDLDNPLAHGFRAGMYKLLHFYTEAYKGYLVAHALSGNDEYLLDAARAIIPNIPIVVESHEAIQEAHQLHNEIIASLIAKSRLFLSEPTEKIGFPIFAAHHGINVREMHENLARLYRKICPVLNYTAAHCEQPTSRTGKIKIGFMLYGLYDYVGRSSNLYHACLSGILTHFSRDKFDVTLIIRDLGNRKPSLKKQYHLGDSFLDLPKNFIEARKKIAAERFDILFYADHCLNPLTYHLAFARLAPVQCCHWWFPVTTGLDTMDYYLSGDGDEPDNAQEHYTERLVRLKHRPVYYYRSSLPATLLPRNKFGLGDLVLEEDSHVYLCPARIHKFHPDYVQLIAQILCSDPSGIAVIPTMGGDRGEIVETTVLNDALARLIPNAYMQVRFVHQCSLERFLNLIAISDVMLDSPHFNHGTTVLEAFAIGLPVVTLPKEFFRGRFTYSYYKQMGFMECVAKDEADYVRIALRLGSDKAYRARVSDEIRVRSGVLYEDIEAVRELEEFFISAHARGKD